MGASFYAALVAMRDQHVYLETAWSLLGRPEPFSHRVGLFMNKVWANVQYNTNITSNKAEGWTALELTTQIEGHRQGIARIIFWDAEGQFSFEMSTREIPLDIIEEFIAEAKNAIKTR
jgi:hypothetical protein